ncbi:LysE/ArgO family amino acid transporter [Seleniivibrio woodruffii]|uniref:LysE/ArgO family amino acid transporter n=1 Tax=Seleniivibrio woodruffii TaxID=1078050 RepID=UPI0024095424|nr:LysE/ArgO family amino acid transporter [Seleniivibrio woodruffii]
MTAFVSGFSTGAGLIIAIGAQNAFVLTQSVKRNHHFKVALICAFFDVLFIMTGVAGVGSYVASNPTLMAWATWGGALFLYWYGFLSLKSAFSHRKMELSDETDSSVKKTLLATIAVTVLNPHVYLDTVLLVGSISAGFMGNGRYVFGLGASTASVLWFFALVLFGSALARVFARPIVWRILDGVVCCTMWGVATSLII